MRANADPFGGDTLEALQDFLDRQGHLPREDVRWICTVSEPLVLRRGALLREPERTSSGCGVLLDGVLQSFGLSPQGQRAVLDLIFPGTLALPTGPSGLGEPLGACIEAVTTCTLRVWPDELCRMVLDRHPGWQRFRLRVLEDALVNNQQRFMAARLLTAEERYAKMTRELPQAWQQLPQRLIASYLGITPQYLSSIKREMRGALAPPSPPNGDT